MDQPEDNTGLGWDGEGTTTPAPTGPVPSTPPPDSPTVATGPTGPDAPTVAQPVAPAPTPPPPPQPLGVPAPLPGDPTRVAGVPSVAPTMDPSAGAVAYQGTATGPMAAVPGTGYPAAPGGGPPGGTTSNRGLWIALAILGAIVLIGGVVATVLLLRGSDTTTSETLPATSPSPASSSTTSSSTQPVSSAPATAPVETAATAPPQTTPNVASLPGGLLCKDLAARGLGYADAVRYYKREGYPDRMDADNNGIPCETVYSAASVQAYWGTVRTGSTLGLPSGLFCRDLHDRGFDYGSAVEYFIADGFPDRMDADHNGIPCETVYSAVEVHGFWDTVN